MNALPTPAVVLIAVATAVVWLIVLMLVVAELYAGNVLVGLSSVFSTPGLADRPGLQNAMLFQWGVTGTQLLLVLVLGTVILVQQISGNLNGALCSAAWFIRGLIVIQVLGLFSGLATPFAAGGSIVAVLPVLAVTLPVSLVVIAFLVCADRYVTMQSRGGVFD